MTYWKYDDEKHIFTIPSTQHRHILFFLTSIDSSSSNSIPILLWRPRLQVSVLVLWGKLIPLQESTGIEGGRGGTDINSGLVDQKADFSIKQLLWGCSGD